MPCGGNIQSWRSSPFSPRGSPTPTFGPCADVTFERRADAVAVMPRESREDALTLKFVAPLVERFLSRHWVVGLRG